MNRSAKEINADLDMENFDLEAAYDGLPRKARAFVDAYYGSIKRACELSGCSYGYAYVLSQRNDIKAILRSKIRNSASVRSMIATREERQVFWSRIMHDPEASQSDKMKASELLGRSYCDFAERKIIEGGANPLVHQFNLSVEERIKQLRKELPAKAEPKDDLDFI